MSVLHLVDEPIRVLHLNLGTVGIGHYGYQYALALQSTPGIEPLSVLRADVLAATIDYSSEMHPTIQGVRVEGRPLVTLVGAIIRLAKAFRPDIVHDTAGIVSLRGAIAASVLSLFYPLVTTEHDAVPHVGMDRDVGRRIARWFERRRSRYLAVHGAKSLELLVAQGIPRERVVVSPIGHYGFFDTSDGPNTVRRPRDILFFGALRPNKGVGLLPAIARRLLEVDPAARLVVAGSRDVAASLRKGSWPGQLDAILDELSKLPNCELHIRFIPDAEVAPLFRRATVVLLPYLEASQSAVAMIGMALGACVVATPVGDLPEVIQHDVTGVLTPPEVPAIVDAVVGLLRDPSRARRIAGAARDYVRRHHDWTAVAGRLAETYRQVIATRRSGRSA